VTEASPWPAADVAGAVGEPVDGLAAWPPWPLAVEPLAEPVAAPLAADPPVVDPAVEPLPVEPAPAEPPPPELPSAEPDPELVPVPGAGVLTWVADETPEVTDVTAWLAADVTGAAVLVTADAAWDTVDEAWFTAELAEPVADEDDKGDEDDEDDEGAGPPGGTAAVEAGRVAPDTTPLTVLVTPLTTPETVLVTEPSGLTAEPGVDDAGAAVAARLTVAAWALGPDRSQNTVISPKQQPASTRPRAAIRLASLWPADSHVSGTAYSTPV
jgi:hypothetical protein